ncbi:PHD finger protein 21B [Hyaena hyaena]|uniref:PHD finger protein 21B n=1 Tax=Hyaena hyaena TaxID=95912 RepID=UPI0019221AB2|nr:PHD finger protein 21B [Hyaena hyaena]
MELQSRPEALAVEVARHQNGDLKKQLHERQPRIAALSDKQALGTITPVPVTGPQVSSLQRLAGQGAAVLPQVRPKTLIPDSLPVTPGRDRPPKQPPTFQKATVVSIKNPSPALPTANNTVSHEPTPSSQPQAPAASSAVASPLSGAGVAYAIISTAPSSAAVSVVSDSIKVQPVLISADKKVIIIQPQVQTQPESTAESRPPTEEPSQGAQATKKKKEDRPPSQENPEKIAFMVALGLVTTEHLEEIQSKRQERKRRSTANPAYSGLLETERKRLASNYLNTPLFLAARATEDPCWKALKKDDGVPWSGMLAIVHSYVTHKTVKEEEKQKLLQRGGELRSERQQLEERDGRLAAAVKKCLELKTSLLARQRGTQSSLDRLRALLRLIRGEPLLQVTVATTGPTPLLALPWTKPPAAATRPALQQPQGHN